MVSGRGVCLRTTDYERLSEPEPPVTMMLSNFSGGNPDITLANYVFEQFSTNTCQGYRLVGPKKKLLVSDWW